MTISEQINKLIENVKYDEIITLFKSYCIGPLNVFEENITLLSSDLNKYKIDKINSVATDLQINTWRLNIVNLAQKMESFSAGLDEDNMTDLISCSLLINDSFPFIDRSNFRDKIKSAIASDKADIILVKGAPKSGMSYLEKFLRNVSNSLEVLTLIPIEIPAVLGEP